MSDYFQRYVEKSQEANRLSARVAELEAENERMRPVYEAAVCKRQSEYRYRDASNNCICCAEQVAGPCADHESAFAEMLELDGEFDAAVDTALESTTGAKT